MKSVKLATRLEEQLARLFVVISIAVVFVTSVGIYFVALQTQQAASHFISSHVKSIVAEGVSSHSVSEIEREVRRLHQAWTGSQKTFQKSDIRITVAIDGVRVGQAGPIKPFGWLSRSHHQTERLASGQVMSLKTQTDFSKLAGWVGMIVLFLGATSYLGLIYLRRLLAKNIKSLTAPLEARMAWLAEVSLHLPDSVRTAVLPANSPVAEVAALDRSLNAFVLQILRLEERIKEAGLKQARVEVMDRVAHALKGKLAILRLRIENIEGLSIEDRRKLKESVNGLMMSSKDVLRSGRASVALPETTETIGENLILPSVLSIVDRAVQSRNERERLFGHESRISVTVLGDPTDDVPIDTLSATRFEDAIIAIIDNAMEASSDFVQVHCEVHSAGVRIKIKDSGCGIPEDLLPRLLKERATFGKRDGNGLGLFHAAGAIDAVGGKIEIHSKEGLGTTIVIEVPRRTLHFKLEKLVFDTAN